MQQSPGMGDRLLFWALDPANAEAEKKIRTLAMKEEQARREQCLANMRQLSLALYNYHDTHSTFPLNLRNGKDAWSSMILPDLEQSTQYEKSFTDLKQGELSLEKKKGEVSQTKIPVFYAPDSEVAEEQDGADPSTK
ncbi:MAG TPA: hypothetical protein DIT97_04810 [Gimesia maris]|uniref:DUF1559 domain-containing protein n=1 Tax=Gimesia maris TaxID=122 RepID=A0A3D3R2U1_9PLAN|nr:hypothetical protein [Gimesia maris]